MMMVMAPVRAVDVAAAKSVAAIGRHVVVAALMMGATATAAVSERCHAAASDKQRHRTRGHEMPECRVSRSFSRRVIALKKTSHRCSLRCEHLPQAWL
jgi:hypothetical protein